MDGIKDKDKNQTHSPPKYWKKTPLNKQTIKNLTFILNEGHTYSFIYGCLQIMF